MPDWGSWTLFFAVSALSMVLARRLDRAPAQPAGPPDIRPGPRESLPDAAGTPLPPAGSSARPEPLSVQVSLDE